MKKFSGLIISLALISTGLTACGSSQTALTPELQVSSAPKQSVVSSLSKKATTGKIIARKAKAKNATPKKNSGGSYDMTLRFEFTGSMFTVPSEDVKEFLERYGSDIDDWELTELDNDNFDQLGHRRYSLTIYGPDRSRLDSILSSYREHLRSLG